MLYAGFGAPQAVPGPPSAAFKYQRGSGLLGKEPGKQTLGLFGQKRGPALHG